MLNRELTPEQENIARIAKALAHPVRIAILQMLATQDYCYHNDISDVAPIAKSTLSQHLKDLRKGGLIQEEITPSTVKYCINQQNWSVAKMLFGNFFEEVNSQIGNS
ncbi:MAG TPA: winged helix-turn-helix domain-containing protein [Dysgonamonadaceae bacterium]|nr:winged helix-turn-helix domain-containing protein [Dysgonamonadaceae bacterium]